MSGNVTYSGAHGSADNRGFTLLEVLVAVVILGLGYMTVMQNFSISMRNIERLDRDRIRMLTDTLTMEKQLVPKIDGEELEEAEGEEYLKGLRFKLVKVVNERGDIATLVLEKL